MTKFQVNDRVRFLVPNKGQIVSVRMGNLSAVYTIEIYGDFGWETIEVCEDQILGKVDEK